MKIELDKMNGDVIIGDLKITHTFSISDIENLKDRYEVNFVIESNNGNIFYQMPFLDKGESAALFMFKNGKIGFINIGTGFNYPFPPFVITEEDRKIIKERINSIGGPQSYTWGGVFYNEDDKGGSVTIEITYNIDN